jgi:hypothetical protein
MESYKNKSKIATLLSFIAAFIVYVGKDEIAKLLPAEYAFLAGLIVLIAGYFVTQSTENKRVKVAEQMVHEEYQNEDDDPTIEDELNEDYDEIVGEDDGA